jgi:hypothetical protein
MNSGDILVWFLIVFIIKFKLYHRRAVVPANPAASSIVSSLAQQQQ